MDIEKLILPNLEFVSATAANITGIRGLSLSIDETFFKMVW